MKRDQKEWDCSWCRKWHLHILKTLTDKLYRAWIEEKRKNRLHLLRISCSSSRPKPLLLNSDLISSSIALSVSLSRVSLTRVEVQRKNGGNFAGFGFIKNIGLVLLRLCHLHRAILTDPRNITALSPFPLFSSFFSS